MIEMICTNCRRPYPEEGAPYRCPVCGGLFDLSGPIAFHPQAMTQAPGIWRYRQAFPLPDSAPVISLGEGNTPLVWAGVEGRETAFKLEFLNPTGAYKDRGSAVLLSFLRSRGVESAVEDSSGNAGASFAAYAARAGVRAKVYTPEFASGPKQAQIEAYGAELASIPGPRSNAAEAVILAAQAGAAYASHAYLPHGIAGYATIAYELVEQMPEPPAAVIAPAGMGNLLLGLGRGFAALQAAGRVEKLPRLVGVQARACAPLWAVFQYGPSGLGWVSEGETLAEGVRIRHPLRGDAVLGAVSQSGGAILAVDEEEILPGRDALARLGLYVEPTSAIVWSALLQAAASLPGPIAVILTGSGLKTKLSSW